MARSRTEHSGRKTSEDIGDVHGPRQTVRRDWSVGQLTPVPGSTWNSLYAIFIYGCKKAQLFADVSPERRTEAPA